MEQVILAIQSPSDYQSQFQLLFEILTSKQSGTSQNANSTSLLGALYNILSDKDLPPYTRFSCLLIAKDVFLKMHMPFMSALATSKFFQKINEFVRTVDPRKPIEEKGRKVFKDKELGNDFIVLMLESIFKWSQRFPSNSQQEPTKLRKAYTELVKEGVVFPTKLRFYSNRKEERGDGNKEPRKGTSKNERTEKNERNERNEKKERVQAGFKTPTGDEPGSPSNWNGEESIKQSLKKISGFLNLLRECESEDQARSEIERYHKYFQQESNINNMVINKELEADERTLTQELFGVLILINDFYAQENQAFKSYLEDERTFDLKSYIDSVTADSEALEPYCNVKQVEKPAKKSSKPQTPPSPRPVQQQSQPQPSNYHNDHEGGKVVQKPKVVQKQASIIKSKPSYKREQDDDRQYRNQPISNINNLINDQQLQQMKREGEYHIKDFFENTHPVSSFRAIKRQLQQQMGDRAQKSRSRSRKPKSQSKRVRGQHPSHSPSSFKSKVSIFDLKINSVVKDDDYSGTLVRYSNEYLVGSVNQYQGNKRLKRSNLLNKGILFQNQMLQIGYKTQPYYQQVNGYRVSLRMVLFYGNKSESTISKFQVEFQGDENSLLYRNPQYLPDEIEPGHQVKQELYVVPIQIPFGLLSLNIQYSMGRQFPEFTVYLPNSLVKYLVPHSTTASKFQDAYNRQLDYQFRSEIFSLSREFDIETFQKLFPDVIYLTKLEDFISQKEYNELVLGVFALLINSEQYLIRIYIRPNMTSVIQLVRIDDSESENTYAKLLVQSLQFLLQSS